MSLVREIKRPFAKGRELAKRPWCRLMERVNRRRWAEGEPPEVFVLSGTPRGGTTWVAEVMAAGLGASVIWEPLYPTSTGAVRGLGCSAGGRMCRQKSNGMSLSSTWMGF